MLKTPNTVTNPNLVTVDERNRRLVISGYEPGTNPSQFGQYLISLASQKKLEKIWLWALPEDVPKFIRCGFLLEGSTFRGNSNEFTITLAYYVSRTRKNSNKLKHEDDIIQTVRTKRINRSKVLPSGITLKLLNETFAPQISQLLTKVFVSYPSPIENPEYIRALIRHGNIFAGAFSSNKLIAVSAAYPEASFNRCEMTDCATLENYRGLSISEHLLQILEHEVLNLAPYNLYTLARAQSYGMNRVFHKLGYSYRGRLINNCHIAGSFEDMNLWVK
jgi:putative beta-lysine N-acetyltransferase